PILDEFLASELVPYAERLPELAYVGGITARRGVREMVEAVGRLSKGLDAKLALAGDFRPLDLEAEVRVMHGWERVNFLGWQNRSEVAMLLGRVRAGLVVLHPEPNYLEAYPVKLFEYMAAGLPVIASNFPLWREIVLDAGCGLLVDPLDTEAIAEAIQELLENPANAEAMGKRGQTAVRKRYNWDRELEKLLSFYDGMLEGKSVKGL
ncbi:MAG: glycosyltransferase, partial [Desulfobacteraceae bacterium]|nr:glycosyltransferase [Desulfobacteraceae bacterium]